MDITEYPKKLYELESSLTALKNEKARLELQLKRITAPLINEIDKTSYKNSAVRDSLITFTIANNQECCKIEDRLLEIVSELRILESEHAKIRREYRLLEQEYLAHGVRVFTCASS